MSSSELQRVARVAIGRPADWRLSRPIFRLPHAGLHLVGPITVVVSVATSWFAFTGAVGDDGDDPTFGLWIGATAIVLMAWSLVLAVRIRPIEPLFGGLDHMYRVHRWTGALAVVAMFLHTSAEPEVDGIRGASENLADSAEDLAGTGEIMLYVLVGLSLLRWIPYRYWRWAHKLLGIPFVFACFHFYTAEKPYSNGSAWGWWFATFMVAGIAAYLIRVVWLDMIRPGTRYTVGSAEVTGSTLELRLTPMDKHLVYEPGQFAVIKVQQPGLREPHIFTIASSPHEGELRLFIRDLGDWTSRMQVAELQGATVVVEGPYGRFEPTGHGQPTVWIAGGVGITPFLSAAATGSTHADGPVPVLFYSVRERDDAMGLAALEEAHRAGQIELHLVVSAEGERFSPAHLTERFGADGLRGAHVAVCGPTSLVKAADAAARSAGAAVVEREDFDIRQGFGPDLSRDIDALRKKIVNTNRGMRRRISRR